MGSRSGSLQDPLLSCGLSGWGLARKEKLKPGSVPIPLPVLEVLWPQCYFLDQFTRFRAEETSVSQSPLGISGAQSLEPSANPGDYWEGCFDWGQQKRAPASTAHLLVPPKSTCGFSIDRKPQSQESTSTIKAHTGVAPCPVRVHIPCDQKGKQTHPFPLR